MTFLRGACASVLVIVAGVLLIAGVWEIVVGQNLPGLLGWGYLPRQRPRKSAKWQPWQWRRNGVILLMCALALGNLGLTLLHY